MKSLHIYYLLACFCSVTYAQDNSIVGNIIDNNKDPIPGINIQLFNAENANVPIKGTTSDSVGKFTFSDLSKGTYIIEFSHVNFDFYFVEITLKDENITDIGTIVLQEQIQQLDEIVISGKKLLVMQTADKITVNVASGVLSAGGTPVDILKQLPMVSVSAEGNISIRGKSDVQILIDGKPSGFAALQGQSFLDQLDLSTIKRIEVITNPSVIQSTNGAGGVINIVTKKNKANGFNGRVNVGLGSDEWYHISPGINYRFDDVNLFLNYTIRNRKRLSENISLKRQEIDNDIQIIDQFQKGIRDDLRHSTELGLDYYISENSYFTFAGNYRSRDKKDTQNRTTLVSILNDITERRTGTIKEPEANEGWGAIVQYTSSQKSDKSTNVLLDYIHSIEDEDIFREELVSSDMPDFTDGVQSFYVDTNDRLMFDFEQKRRLKDSSKITYGVQAVYRKINQTFNASEFNNNSGLYENIPALNDEFNYEDFVNSIYFQIEKRINDWAYEVAIKFELLENKYNSESINEIFKDGYFKFFPSVKLTYNFNNKTNTIFSIKKGINRPSPNRLNPFPDVTNAFNISVGNPELEPEIFYTIETGLNTKIKKLSLTTGLFYTIYTDLIQQITELQDDGLTFRFPTNVNNMHHYGVDLSLQVNPTKWWNQQLGGLLYSRVYEDDFIETSEQISYQIKSTSTLSITNRIDFQIFGNYNAPENTPQGEIEALYFFDAGFDYEFLNQKAKVSLTATDIFNTLKETSFLLNEELMIRSHQKLNTRRIYLTFNYKL
ncbi:TonB-dependent receptor [uncultured Psychroserpens sp.]|uniref:TonB-dependent receptor domain-containing protein n=1 Tax=uncultured Psychroserpens sp. TaxID=255436 RepID=UPI002606C281|nr:TonB-dependent receptor [uncultured Psychroserpens sp.]